MSNQLNVILLSFPNFSGFHVKESEDNEAVVSTVIDLHRLITTKHLPAVQSWVQVSTKHIEFRFVKNDHVLYCSVLEYQRTAYSADKYTNHLQSTTFLSPSDLMSCLLLRKVCVCLGVH